MAQDKSSNKALMHHLLQCADITKVAKSLPTDKPEEAAKEDALMAVEDTETKQTEEAECVERGDVTAVPEQSEKMDVDEHAAEIEIAEKKITDKGEMEMDVDDEKHTVKKATKQDESALQSKLTQEMIKLVVGGMLDPAIFGDDIFPQWFSPIVGACGINPNQTYQTLTRELANIDLAKHISHLKDRSSAKFQSKIIDAHHHVIAIRQTGRYLLLSYIASRAQHPPSSRAMYHFACIRTRTTAGTTAGTTAKICIESKQATRSKKTSEKSEAVEEEDEDVDMTDEKKTTDENNKKGDESASTKTLKQISFDFIKGTRCLTIGANSENKSNEEQQIQCGELPFLHTNPAGATYNKETVQQYQESLTTSLQIYIKDVDLCAEETDKHDRINYVLSDDVNLCAAVKNACIVDTRTRLIKVCILLRFCT